VLSEKKSEMLFLKSSLFDRVSIVEIKSNAIRMFGSAKYLGIIF